MRGKHAVSMTELEEAPMEIVSGLDMHRSQITFRTVDLRTGEVQRGKIYPGARDAFRDWLERFEAGTDAHFALEVATCTPPSSPICTRRLGPASSAGQCWEREPLYGSSGPDRDGWLDGARCRPTQSQPSTSTAPLRSSS